ncbi:VOC family protein [Culicoidibacter larvae]|uniref:VOC family protein n=1 Tax=Culicoidibacter larvae TaxID=2579976 RepID=A0A5R8Q8V4_9FIRM|nr:VOC family protein [Culicoidibacter larvae]TLG71551.1 VOC family protein [Culicoidibacter larvae]
MANISPFIWMDDTAEQAVDFYQEVFDDVQVDSKYYNLDEDGNPTTLLLVKVYIQGQELRFLNGGPYFKLNEAFSLYITCENQQELDAIWDKLSAEGEIQECGWVIDKFGLAWQVVPRAYEVMQEEGNAKQQAAVMQALLKMKKIEVQGLLDAFESAR